MKAFSYKAILFDVDDTLFDRDLAFTNWVKSYANTQFPDSPRAAASILLQKVLEIKGDGYGSKKELLEQLMTIYPPPETSSYNAAQAYEDFVGFTKLDSSAALLLDLLDSINFPYGIITNGGERQSRKVELLGLPQRTSCIFISGTFGCAKPDQRLFHAAAMCLGYAPCDILMVGDHPVNDILGASHAGMHTAWLPNGKPWPEQLDTVKPDLVLQSISGLKKLVAMQQALHH